MNLLKLCSIVAVSLPLVWAGSGCDVLLPLKLLACDGVPDLRSRLGTYEQDPDDPCLRRLVSDPALLPTYDEVLAHYECRVIERPCHEFEHIRTGTCGDGRYLFLSAGHQFGGDGFVFDATTRGMVSRSVSGDVIDSDGCIGNTYIARVECTDRIVTRVICGMP